MNVKEAIHLIGHEKNLSSSQTEEVFENIFSAKCSGDEVREFLVSLSHKGETVQEILGAVHFLRRQGKRITCQSQNLVDCCGTGGDQKGTFNISTAAAFVLAGAGCHVAKHGNRAMSSKSGSADVLEALGVNISAPEEVVRRCADQIGIGFFFAPNYYPLLKNIASVRKSIPHRTLFNLLGPLLNPAGARRQLIGVFGKPQARLVVDVLKELGSESVVAVCAENGMDEFSLSCVNHVVQLEKGSVKEFDFDPRTSGYPFCREDDVKGGTARENAERLKLCLKGHSQPLDHTVHINAAWGLVAAGRATSFMDGLLMAQEAISNGRAYQKLEELVEMTNC